MAKEDIMIEELTVRTSRRNELIDITTAVRKVVAASGVEEGLCRLFVPHTTAAVTINERADPDVPRDIETTLSEIVPPDRPYRHAEGNSDAHVKTSLVGSTQTLFVSGGNPVLGTWQAVFFCEFDGPRTRRCLVRVSAS